MSCQHRPGQRTPETEEADHPCQICLEVQAAAVRLALDEIDAYLDAIISQTVNLPRAWRQPICRRVEEVRRWIAAVREAGR
jgi:hypothetical protein